MYRIVKRIVHTVTTVTWLVRLEDDSEKEITFPASIFVMQEEVPDTKTISKKDPPSSNPNLDQGEKP
jgi:hypothetical protein